MKFLTNIFSLGGHSVLPLWDYSDTDRKKKDMFKKIKVTRCQVNIQSPPDRICLSIELPSKWLHKKKRSTLGSVCTLVSQRHQSKPQSWCQKRQCVSVSVWVCLNEVMWPEQWWQLQPGNNDKTLKIWQDMKEKFISLITWTSCQSSSHWTCLFSSRPKMSCQHHFTFN